MELPSLHFALSAKLIPLATATIETRFQRNGARDCIIITFTVDFSANITFDILYVSKPIHSAQKCFELIEMVCPKNEQQKRKINGMTLDIIAIEVELRSHE